MHLARVLALLVLSLSLGGCAAVSALQLASIGVSGLSYAVSGKSLSDHALSLALERDCALLRVVQGHAPCRRRGDASGPVAVASSRSGEPGDGSVTDRDLEPWNEAVAVAAVEVPRAGSPALAAPAPEATALAPPPRAAADNGSARPVAAARVAGPGAPPGPRLFAVIASYADPANAEQRRARHGAAGAAVVAFRVGDRTLYRVLLGPYEDPAFGPVKRRLRSARIDDAWPLHLCAESLRPPPCGTLVARAGG